MRFESYNVLKDYNYLLGKTVLCRFYNAMDGNYGGDFFIGVILYKEEIPSGLIGIIRDFVIRKDNGDILTIWCKEIRGILGE